MFSLIKHVFKDVSVLYRNFIHWNISKISIGVFGFLVAFMMVMPFLIMSFILFYILNVDWYAYTGHYFNGSLTDAMKGHKDYYIWFVLGGINMLFYGLGLMYAKIMYFDLNLKYLRGKKSSYLKYKFFNLKLLTDYLKISARIFGLLSIPVISMFIFMIILVASAGGVNNAGVEFATGNQLLVITSFIALVISIFVGIYLIYRSLFSYILLVDKSQLSDEKRSTKDLLKASFKRTKGWKKPLKLLGILLLFSIIIAPFTVLGQGLNDTYSNLKNFQIYRTVSDSEKTELLEYKPYYYSELQLKYADISEENIEKNIQIYYYFIIFFKILTFLIISGIMEMVIVSFYKRELTHK